MAKIRAAAVQMKITADKAENIRTAGAYLERLQGQGVDFVVLPEMFCCPYQTRLFPEYAEEEGGPVWEALALLAKRHGVYLIGGSVPERDEQGRIFNTSYIFNREGRQIGKHRKAHMFDIAVKNGQFFRESDTLTPGNAVTVFDTEFGTMGAIICFDIRFPEFLRLTADRGAKVIFAPAAFNMTTGPVHWELSFRTRALDNQVYMVGCAPARDPSAGYTSWGHTICTDPWGGVVSMLDEKEGVLTADMDLDYVDRVRRQLPLLSARRSELYHIEYTPDGQAGS